MALLPPKAPAQCAWRAALCPRFGGQASCWPKPSRTTQGWGVRVFLPPGGAADKTERNPFPMKMKTIPWKSAFLRVALGQAVSQLGSHGVQFALIWWLAEETASPGVLGACLLYTSPSPRD